MVEQRPAGELLGRNTEIDRLGRLIDEARRGQSGILVLLGEAGVGKTALVNHCVGSVSGVRVLRAVGVEWEMELPFAALQQLCAPVLDRLDGLPGPQQAALRTVFGLSDGDPPDRLVVGLAVLSLLSGVGAEEPLVCVVDDAQWLDQASAQTLAFVARRLLADPVAIIFAGRTRLELLTGFAELVLEGIDDRQSRLLLDALIPFPLDSDVRERIVAETRGNPLALRELPRGLSPAELAGGFALPFTVPVPARVEETFRRRLEALPADVRGLLLVAAAEPVGNPVVVRQAAQALGFGGAAAADSDGLLEIGARVVFRHPLVRSAVYEAASPQDRRGAHRALAEATEAEVDPDRRAWHLAQAAAGPDEEVAAELERSAGRAQARSGLAAAAAFLERAAALTLDPALRARRALAAAESMHLAGGHPAALRILSAAETGPLDELQRARADLLRAEIAYTERRGNDAPKLLLRAAGRLEPLDRRAARDTYLDAMIAGHFAGRLAAGGGLREAAGTARHAPRPAGSPTPSDQLLDGLATATMEGYPAGAPVLARAVEAFRGPDVTLREELRWLWPAAHVAMSLWDDGSYVALARRHIELARQSGLLAVLPTALTTCIVAHTFLGQLTAAERLTAELRTLTDAMGVPMPPYGPLFVAGWRGREQAASAAVDAAVADSAARGEGGALAFADYARAVLGNGLGHYGEAQRAAAATDRFEVEGFVIQPQGLVELVEAAARAGAAEQAAEALTRLSAMAGATGTDWALGIEARSRALLSDGDAAERLYREAIERLARTRIRPQLARAHLVFGEWLRRQNRRADARHQLRTAREMLSAMGLEAFAERAGRELMATGETVRKRSVDKITELTAQEAHIARLAGAGYTNPEISAQLFLSARTVEWHLRKIFTKLGVASRRELGQALDRLVPMDAT